MLTNLNPTPLFLFAIFSSILRGYYRYSYSSTYVYDLINYDQSKIQTDYHYYDLTYKKCYYDPNQEWTIHGLWPELNSHKWPSYCNTSSPFELKGLNLTRMRDRWTSCKRDPIDSKSGVSLNDYNFWKHEWEKHGTCSPFNLTEYFDQALQLDTWVINQDILKNYCSQSAVECMIPFSLNFTLLPLQYSHKI